jgi:hypothetical protein
MPKQLHNFVSPNRLFRFPYIFPLAIVLQRWGSGRQTIRISEYIIQLISNKHGNNPQIQLDLIQTTTC